MKRRRLILVGIMVMIIVMVGALFACVNPEKDLKKAEEQVKESAVKEEPLLHDNGKNFFVIDAVKGSNAAYGYDFFIAATQKWVDDHPDKKIIPVGSPSHSYIWIVYYEDRKKGCE